MTCHSERQADSMLTIFKTIKITFQHLKFSAVFCTVKENSLICIPMFFFLHSMELIISCMMEFTLCNRVVNELEGKTSQQAALLTLANQTTLLKVLTWRTAAIITFKCRKKRKEFYI